MRKPSAHAPLFILCLFLAACSGTDTVQQRRTVEEIYAEAMEAYKNNDWTEAAAKFDLIKLQYPASQFADDAQYYIAEINFRRGEYVMAAYNYSVVRRSFPSSEWAKGSSFRVGECYQELMLPPDRDQEYTRKAIQAYTEFQQLYPTDSLAFKALERIHTLRNTLAERNMLIAEHYIKTNSRKAAVAYFDAVIDEYPDSDYLEDALVGKIRLQYMMTQIADCRTTIANYRRMVRDPKRADEVNDMERNLP
jgi:outer membrane protein assembly factor BamD